jgi:hypothetical protein
MRTTIFRVALLLVVCLTAGGCTGTIIREASGAVMGAKGTFMPIMPLSPDKQAKPLGQYRRFELGPITDDIGGKTPVGFAEYLQREFPDEVKKARLPDQLQDKALVIRGKIIYYESASTVGYVLGPLEEVICRAEMVDKQTGRVLGVANCVGRTKAVNNSGVRTKASGLAKAFVRWIEARFPEDLKTPAD